MSAVELFLIISMLLVVWFDLTRFIIPNWICGMLLAAYPAAVLMAPVPVEWPAALAGMALTFGVGYVLYAMKWMGGGDIKLLVVLSLWAGQAQLLDFILMVALMGGALALSVWMVRRALRLTLLLREKAWKLPRILRDGEPIPYGLAIAAGFLWLMSMGKIAVIQ